MAKKPKRRSADELQRQFDRQSAPDREGRAFGSDPKGRLLKSAIAAANAVTMPPVVGTILGGGLTRPKRGKVR